MNKERIAEIIRKGKKNGLEIAPDDLYEISEKEKIMRDEINNLPKEDVCELLISLTKNAIVLFAAIKINDHKSVITAISKYCDFGESSEDMFFTFEDEND